MKSYTIGIVFNKNLDGVILIKKNRPDWQKDRLNFPGGHIEENESPLECVYREFKEECDLNIPQYEWHHIGVITNPGSYLVEIFTAILPDGAEYKTMTDEEVGLYSSTNLPINVLSNLKWLVPFAKNFHQQGNNDLLNFGTFEYTYQ